MDKVIISGQERLEEMVFALRIHMWARPCGGNGVCVNDSWDVGKDRLEAMVFALIIHSMWARPGGVYNDLVKDS